MYACVQLGYTAHEPRNNSLSDFSCEAEPDFNPEITLAPRNNNGVCKQQAPRTCLHRTKSIFNYFSCQTFVILKIKIVSPKSH